MQSLRRRTVLLCGWLLLVGLLTGCQARRQRQAVGTAQDPEWTQSEACRVQELKQVGIGGGGVDWSPTGDNRIAYAAYDDNKVKQVYTMQPDGSESQCVTCEEIPGGPTEGVHKGVPSWHPSGEYLVLQVEMEEHPLPSSIAEPGSGWFNNVWAMRPDGSQWWQLTNYTTERASGVLFPRPSSDGARLAWAEVYKGPDNPIRALAGNPTGNPWGRWRMNFADWVADDTGVRLENVQNSRPGEGNFYEMQDWSPDGSRVLFAADIGRDSPYVLDLWTMDVASGQLTALTDTDDHWEEQAAYSPSGKKIVFMSSACCEWNPKDWKTLATELYLMNADGSNRVRLTHFNTEGYPEWSGDRSAPTMASWSPDGRQLILERLQTANYSGGERQTELWLLTFEGACGTE